MHCVCFEIHPEGSLSHGGVAQPAVIDQWAIQAGISLGPVMELGSVEAIKKVVGAGLGFGVIPRMAVRNLHRGLTVRSLSPKLHRKLAIVLRHDKPLQRALREVVTATSAFARDFAGPRRPGC